MSDIGNRAIFAKNLSYYIERSGKTQKDISEALNIATSTLSNWVTGNKYPRMGSVEMLANYFGIQKSDLIAEKMTEEKGKDNELIANIIVRLRMDEAFRSLVASLYEYDSDKIHAVENLLKALGK